MEWRKDQFVVTDDRARVDVNAVERLLRSTYWASDRPRSAIEACLAGALCFSLLDGDVQVGCARVVSDGVTIAWVADVVVDERYRGQGLGKWLMACIMEHPTVKGSARQLLRTKDAHGLYEQFGFERAECMTRSNDGRIFG